MPNSPALRAKSAPNRLSTLRHAVRHMHMWLGLTLGGLFALIGLTGSILVFYPEIDVLLNQEIQIESSTPPDFDQALATVRAEWPDKIGPWRFEVTGKQGAIPARYYNPSERAGHDFRPMMVWLSPDGTRILRRDYWGEYAMTFIYDLHYRLLLGEAGGKVLGWIGFAVLALILSGLWAWWPRGALTTGKAWAKALRIPRHAPPVRRWRDWHKTAGLAAALSLPLLVGTGIILELPKEADTALNAMGLPVDTSPILVPMQHSSSRLISISQAITTAQTTFPGAKLAWIEVPPKIGGAYRIRVQVENDPSKRFPHSYVWIDSTSGKPLALQDHRQAKAGALIKNWSHPLHDGSAGGLIGRVLTAISGLLPLVLFVTGILRWRARH